MTFPEQEPASVIGFDGSRLSGRSRTGTETYAFELLHALASLAQPGEVRVYLNTAEPPDGLPEGLDSVLMPSRRLWTHGRLSWEMRRNPPDLLFVPSHVIPAAHPRSVVTIHDLAFLAQPEAFSRRERYELDLATRWNARAATKIISVSRRTKLDLIEHYGTAPEKIVVIHHGVNDRFQPASQDEIDRVRGMYELHRTFVLCVGTLHPRKNYPNVIAAFEQAVGIGLDVDLVICGEAGRHSASTLGAIDSSPVRDRIHLLRYVDADDLPPLYSAAALVMLASLYEGFGLPALEAMACGAPVTVSSTGALPEVTGNAARTVDPLDVESLAGAMLDIGSVDQRRHLRTLGRQWSSRFTWERSATLTLNVLRAVRDGREINDERLGWSDLATAPPRTIGKDGEL
jgi:glycosyltransferase involved in cell wall biosynthesis